MREQQEQSALNKNRGTFILLQGLATPFLAVLAEKLIESGHTVHRVNYCGGDWYFSFAAQKRATCTNFTKRQSELADFYTNLFAEKQPDAVILFGDCRPIHTEALEIAKSLSIPVYVFEEGYTRPNWITMEKGGTNSFSSLPRTRGEMVQRHNDILEHAESAPPIPTQALPNPMGPRVRMDLVFHLSNMLGKLFFRGYKTHRPAKVSEELSGWLKRLGRNWRYKRENTAMITAYEQADQPFFLVPLQLNSDYQIRIHSNYKSVPDFVSEVITSFAGNAPKDCKLLFKAHPLDNGMINYRATINEAAAKLGIGDRVDYIEGGNLNILLDKTQGAVMINSTVGYAALQQGTPVKVTGKALYDMQGLSHQGDLNKFWTEPQAPDNNFVNMFITVVRHDSQLYGDFFTRKGIELAANAATNKLTAFLQETAETSENV